MASSVLVCLAMLVVGQGPAVALPTTAEIAAQIARLGDERFSVREQATEQLWQWGDASESALQVALKSNDAEVRVRAKSIVDRFNLGIYPDMPTESVAVVRQYRVGNQTQKIAAIERLKTLEDWRTLSRLQRSEADAAIKNHIAVALRGDYLKRVAASVETDDLLTAESVLRSEYVINDPLAQRQLATIYLLRGDLNARIRELQDELHDKAGEQQLRLLRTLHEAAGDDRAANELLTKSIAITPANRIDIAVRQRDWKKAAEVSDVLIAASDGPRFDMLAYSAMYHRLNGNAQQADKRLEEVIAAATPELAWVTQKILLLHERVEPALESLQKLRPSMAFEILCIRHDFDKAFALADVRPGRVFDETWFDALPAGDVRPNEDEQYVNRRHILALQVGYFLHQLGHKQDAEQVFAMLRKLDRRGSTTSVRWRRAELCRIESRLGLDDEALRDAADYMESKNDPSFLATFFGRQGPSAEHWNVLLRSQSPEGPLADRLATVRMLLRPKPTEKRAKRYRLLVDGALASVPVEKGPERVQRVEAIVDALVAHGERQAAIDLLRQDNLSSLLYLRGGDLLREDNQHEAAALQYAKIGAGEIHRPLGLYLHGVCEAALGHSESAVRLKERAVLLSVENAARTLLFSGVATRRLTKDADYLRNVFTHTSADLNVVLSKEYGDAAAESDPSFAAGQWDIVLVRLTNASATLLEDAGYVSLNYGIHRARAKAALTAGKKDDFQCELAACLRLLPYSWEAVDDIVPKMDAAGWEDEADALFQQQLIKVQTLAKAYPNSARFSNAVAWISASCKRNLDDALVQAEHTLELAPDNPSYLDTLAEVHFAQGKFLRAVEIQRRVVELAPVPLFRERLERFEAAAQQLPTEKGSPER